MQSDFVQLLKDSRFLQECKQIFYTGIREQCSREEIRVPRVQVGNVTGSRCVCVCVCVCVGGGGGGARRCKRKKAELEISCVTWVATASAPASLSHSCKTPS